MKMKKTVRLFAPALGLLALVVLETGCGSSGTLDPPDPAGRNQQQVQQPSRTFGGPPLSGIFDAAASLLQEAPGQGRIAQVTCTDGTNLGGGNIRINCDSTDFPHNETAIAGDPSNKNHLVAGSNDYELFFMGAAIIQRIIAGYYTSFDGGTTWLNGHVPIGEFNFSGDPSVAFNKKLGLVHYGVAAFHGGQGGGFSDLSIQVNTSTDGGKTFGDPVVVTRGTGGHLVSVANDKPYITVDNHSSSPFYGRLYVTWTRFVLSPHFNQAPIFLSFSDDGGRTFSTPKEISGSSATLCAHPFIAANAGVCNEDQFSSPVVGPDGTLYVAYENFELQGKPEFRGQFLVVRSTNGGATFSNPAQVVGPIFDGLDDYPVNVDGRQTLTNSEFRVNSAGNLAVDPSSGPGASSTRLFLSFSDNRHGNLTGNFLTVTTNTDVFIATSTNGGATWNAAHPVLSGAAAQNDQFYPWADVSATGVLKVRFADRSFDADNVKYGQTLASSTDGVSFTAVRVDSGLSNPNDSRWFTNGGTTNGKATFIGDYDGLVFDTDGVAHPMWTDMRSNVSAAISIPPGRGHKTQNAVTAAQ